LLNRDGKIKEREREKGKEKKKKKGQIKIWNINLVQKPKESNITKYNCQKSNSKIEVTFGFYIQYFRAIRVV